MIPEISNDIRLSQDMCMSKKQLNIEHNHKFVIKLIMNMVYWQFSGKNIKHTIILVLKKEPR